MWIPNTTRTVNLRRQKNAQKFRLFWIVCVWQFCTNSRVDILRALRLISMLYYKKNVIMMKPSFLKFNDPSVANHLSKYMLLQQLVEQEAQLDLEDASNYVWAVCNNFTFPL